VRDTLKQLFEKIEDWTTSYCERNLRLPDNLVFVVSGFDVSEPCTLGTQFGRVKLVPDALAPSGYLCEMLECPKCEIRWWLGHDMTNHYCPTKRVGYRPLHPTTHSRVLRIHSEGGNLILETDWTEAGDVKMNQPEIPDGSVTIRDPLSPAVTGPLDVEYDGQTLRNLLSWDQRNRAETGGPRACRLIMSDIQRAAVSAHWSAELRAKVAASSAANVEHKQNQVMMPLDAEDCEW